jgi:hypothetical protein
MSRNEPPGEALTPSELWLRQRPHATLNDYVQAMQAAPSKEKHERFLDAMAPGVPRGTFKWSKTGSNGYLLAVWGLLASLPLFGLLIVVWDVWGRK